MNFWEILDIEPTNNKREIKRAYARLTAKYHPEEFPEEFKQIHEAYQQALQYAEHNEQSIFFREPSFSFGYPEKSEDTEADSQESEIDFGKFVIYNQGETDMPNEESKLQEESIDFSQYDDIQKKSRWQKITDEKQEELNFDDLLEAGEKKGLSLKREEEIDFSPVEKIYEDDKRIEKAETSESDKDSKSRERKIKILEAVFLCIGVCVWLYMQYWIRMDRIEENQINTVSELVRELKKDFASEEEKLKNILEERYQLGFTVAPIAAPENVIEVYYLISEGKTVNDYKWFLVQTSDSEIPVSFYASWNKEEGFQYDYGYRQLFAFIKAVGLGSYIDDKDSYNMEHFEKKEQRYSYPVLCVTGSETDAFYDQLGECIDLIAKSEASFEENDYVALNLKNPKIEGYYVLKINKEGALEKDEWRKNVEAIVNIGNGVYEQWR